MNGSNGITRGWKGRSPLPLDMLSAYNPNRAGSMEAVWQPFYDFQTYSSAGSTQMLFFQIPAGQSSKTLADTNMTNAGMFPAPTMFLCTGIQVVFESGASTTQALTATRALNQWADTVAVANSGWLEFLIGSKVYLRDAPIGKFPPNFTVAGVGAVSGVDSDLATTSSIDVQFARAAGRYYDITPFVIPQTQNFQVSLNWPTAQTVSANGRIGVILDGFYYRQSQ